MTFKAIASAIAISSAMLMSGGAYAQTMLNGVEVSADELPKVQERCDQLALAAGTASLADADGKADDTAGGADATIPSVGTPNELANATSTIDLDSVTLEACIAAGLSGK